MRTLAYIVTLLAVHSTSGGQPTFSAPHDQNRGYYLDTESGPPGRCASGGNFAPDRAEPIWGRVSKLLGYACAPVSANGD